MWITFSCEKTMNQLKMKCRRIRSKLVNILCKKITRLPQTRPFLRVAENNV